MSQRGVLRDRWWLEKTLGLGHAQGWYRQARRVYRNHLIMALRTSF